MRFKFLRVFDNDYPAGSQFRVHLDQNLRLTEATPTHVLMIEIKIEGTVWISQPECGAELPLVLHRSDTGEETPLPSDSPVELGSDHLNFSVYRQGDRNVDGRPFFIFMDDMSTLRFYPSLFDSTRRILIAEEPLTV